MTTRYFVALLSLLALSLVPSAMASAAQCQLLDASQAHKAAVIINKANGTVEFCNPCEDRRPSTSHRGEGVWAVPWGNPAGSRFEVQIDGRSIDLAYTFVQTRTGIYENVGRMVGCKANGSVGSLSVLPSGATTLIPVGRKGCRPDKAVSPASARHAEGLAVAGIKKRMIQESIESYPGPCACPYNTARNGSACGGRSAWSRPGGYSPLCYPRDISVEMVDEYKRTHAEE